MPPDSYSIVLVLAVAIWVSLAIAVGYLARSKGYGMGLGIAIALVTSFAVAFVIFLLLPNTTPEHRQRLEQTRERARSKRDAFERAKARMWAKSRSEHPTAPVGVKAAD